MRHERDMPAVFSRGRGKPAPPTIAGLQAQGVAGEVIQPKKRPPKNPRRPVRVLGGCGFQSKARAAL